MWIADGWKDYEVIDCSKGEKLERWGKYILLRPDPQVIWDTQKTEKGWRKMNGHYHRSSRGGGEWEFFDLPHQWELHYKDLTFNLKPFSFKHTGLFPEQAVNWDWFGEKIRNAGRPIKVLNLFAYTGGATLAAAAAGASVTHVDASKGMVNWAKENAAASGLSGAPIRWLVDDCTKFVEREIRRGNHYDAIIMDPPSYGRGPKGEIWKIEDAIHPLIKLCTKILSDDPLFFLVNSCMTVIGLKIRTFPVFFKAWILLYLASFLLGGIMSWLRLYFGKFFRIISFLFTLGICGFFLLYHGLLFLKKLWKSQDHSFDVILTVNGKDFHLKAFLDSGNHLSDPLTGKPVHIISKDACQKISSQISPGRLRYIPYRTIQKTTSILPVFSVKKMRITGESEFLIQSPLIGISEQKNFGNGKYEMLLHPEDC